MTRRWVTLALLLLPSACKDSPSEPVEPFVVAFSNVVRQVGWNETTQPRRYECRYELTARAVGGEAGDQASWLESERQFRWADGSQYTYSLGLVDMLDYWGSNTIRTGEVQTANRIAWSSQPFNLAYTIRYQEPDGRVKSDFIYVTCR